jgi:hypothetical protein
VLAHGQQAAVLEDEAVFVAVVALPAKHELALRAQADDREEGHGAELRHIDVEPGAGFAVAVVDAQADVEGAGEERLQALFHHFQQRRPGGPLSQHLGQVFVIGQLPIGEDVLADVSLHDFSIQGRETAIRHVVARAEKLENLGAFIGGQEVGEVFRLAVHRQPGAARAPGLIQRLRHGRRGMA